jgi:hypothetical protein
MTVGPTDPSPPATSGAPRVTVPGATRPAAPAGLFRRNRWKLIALGLLLLIGLVGAGYTAAVLAFSYSSGERVGFVQKMSKKGWLCRTWEGELAMSPVPGAPPQLFPFTVPDDAVAARISAAEGKRVSIIYEQKVGLPTSCFGETPYFVTDVRVVAQ